MLSRPPNPNPSPDPSPIPNPNPSSSPNPIPHYQVLLHCSDLAVLYRAVEALRLLMLPLAYCGALVPYLPQGLHPDVHTLLTDSVEPFIVGVHTSHFSGLQASLNPSILVVDLDLGALATGSGVGSGSSGSGHGHGNGHGAAKPSHDVHSHDISAWLRLPLLVETQRQMLQAVGAGGLQPHKLVASWRLLFRQLAHLEHSPLRSSAIAAEVLAWERVRAMHMLAEAVCVPGSPIWEGGAPDTSGVRLLLAEQIDAAFAPASSGLGRLVASLFASRAWREWFCAGAASTASAEEEAWRTPLLAARVARAAAPSSVEAAPPGPSWPSWLGSAAAPSSAAAETWRPTLNAAAAAAVFHKQYETSAAMQAQLVAQLELHAPPPASPWPEHRRHVCSLSAPVDSTMRPEATPSGSSLPVLCSPGHLGLGSTGTAAGGGHLGVARPPSGHRRSVSDLGPRALDLATKVLGGVVDDGAPPLGGGPLGDRSPPSRARGLSAAAGLRDEAAPRWREVPWAATERALARYLRAGEPPPLLLLLAHPLASHYLASYLARRAARRRGADGAAAIAAQLCLRLWSALQPLPLRAVLQPHGAAKGEAAAAVAAAQLLHQLQRAKSKTREEAEEAAKETAPAAAAAAAATSAAAAVAAAAAPAAAAPAAAGPAPAAPAPAAVRLSSRGSHAEDGGGPSEDGAEEDDGGGGGVGAAAAVAAAAAVVAGSWAEAWSPQAVEALELLAASRSPAAHAAEELFATARRHAADGDAAASPATTPPRHRGTPSDVLRELEPSLAVARREAQEACAAALRGATALFAASRECRLLKSSGGAAKSVGVLSGCTVRQSHSLAEGVASVGSSPEAAAARPKCRWLTAAPLTPPPAHPTPTDRTRSPTTLLAQGFPLGPSGDALATCMPKRGCGDALVPALKSRLPCLRLLRRCCRSPRTILASPRCTHGCTSAHSAAS